MSAKKNHKTVERDEDYSGPEPAETVGPLIIRCTAKGSRRVLLTPTITNEVNKTTVPGLDLYFEEENRMCWHSGQVKFMPTWLRHYGSHDDVVAAIKEAMDVQMELQRGLYEYVTESQYTALVHEGARADILGKALSVATESPDDEDSKELLEIAKRMAAKAKTTVKRGIVHSEDIKL